MQTTTIPPRWICNKCKRQFCGVMHCPFCYQMALPTATAFRCVHLPDLTGI